MPQPPVRMVFGVIAFVGMSSRVDFDLPTFGELCERLRDHPAMLTIIGDDPPAKCHNAIMAQDTGKAD